MPTADKHSSETLGARIKRLRMALGLQQVELAEKAGIHAATLNQIEKNKRAPSANSITNLAAVLNVSRDALVDGEKPPAKAPTPTANEPNPRYVNATEDPHFSEAVQAATAEIFSDIAHAILDALTSRREARAGGQATRARTGTTDRTARN